MDTPATTYWTNRRAEYAIKLAETHKELELVKTLTATQARIRMASLSRQDSNPTAGRTGGKAGYLSFLAEWADECSFQIEQAERKIVEHS